MHTITGFRNKDLVILEDEFPQSKRPSRVLTDDGSYGQKGLVTDALKELIESGEKYDEVIAIGPLVMMKFVKRTDQAVPHPHRCQHEPHHDRRHGHVRRLPADRGRQNQVRLRGRPGF